MSFTTYLDRDDHTITTLPCDLYQTKAYDLEQSPNILIQNMLVTLSGALESVLFQAAVVRFGDAGIRGPESKRFWFDENWIRKIDQTVPDDNVEKGSPKSNVPA